MSLRTTPFHARTGPLSEGQAWRRWAGYLVASSYELSHDREYHAIRNAAALFDVSPLYKYLVTGRDAARLLDHIVTRNVAKAKVGQVLYTPWCDAEGKQIDDGTISVLGEQTFRMTSADPTLRWLHLNASGLEVSIEDVSESTAALSLQGPNSRAILQIAAERDLSALKYFRLTAANIRGIPVTISRTGYTGDLGYEVWVDAPHAVPLWDVLIEIGTAYGITPAGMLALDVARIEAGLLLIEVDYFSSRHARPRLDRRHRQGTLQRATGARRRAAAGSGVAVHGTERRLGFVGAALRRRRVAAAAPDSSVADERPDLRARWTSADRLRDQRRLVAAPQAVYGARASRFVERSARHGSADGGHRRAPAQTGEGSRDAAAIL